MDKIINLSLTRKNVPTRMDVVQYATTPNIVFVLEDFTPEEGATASLYIEKADGTKIYNACTIEDNKITYTPTTQSFAALGKTKCQLQIIETNGTAVSFLIWADISENIIDSSAVESQDEFTRLEEALQEMSQYDGAIAELQDDVAALDTRTGAVEGDVTALGVRTTLAEDDIEDLGERMLAQENAPYQYEPEREAKYQTRVRQTLASWLEADYLSTSFVNNQRGKEAASNVYGGYKYSQDGYMKAPIDAFIYGQSRTVKDKYSEEEFTIQTMPMDCCTFTSLITKGYSFNDSVYKDSILGLAYDRTKAIKQATFIHNQDRNDYIGYDGNNNYTTHEWAECLYYSGAKFLEISYKAYGSTPEINTDAIASLETGDIIFLGLGNASRESQFLGIHHTAMYVRDLTELNAFLSDGRQARISDVIASTRYTGHPEWGYIVHVYNDGIDIRGINVLRIDTLEWAMNAVPQKSGQELNHWGRVWAAKVQPNTLNVAGGFEASTSIRPAWGKFRITNWDDLSSYFSVRTSNGGVEAGSIGSSGASVTYTTPIDFNTLLENGDYAFRSNSESSGYLANNINRPCNMFGVLHVRNNPQIEMYKDSNISAPNCNMLTQTFDAYSGVSNFYYKLQRHVGVNTAGSPHEFTQWYILETNDPRGTDKSNYPAGIFPDCETEIKPITRKRF